ncbi:MAG: hypothetical protein NT167_26925, partial [Verrucomicrobia bacterium]|nr:hypothetical protein [Verrucomicrobiota bacterium]
MASRPNLSSFIAALLSMVAVFKMRALNYTDFGSTNGLSLVGVAAQHGAVLRLTPAAQEQVGSAWAIKEQQCAAGFDTAFRLL